MSQIGGGCWPIGGPFRNLEMGAGWDGVDDDSALKALDYAIRQGMNIFDTADVYGLGKSEELIGRALEKAFKEGVIQRSDVAVVSKVGYFSEGDGHGFEPQRMRKQLDGSLKRLGLDYLDVYFFHHLDFGPGDVHLAPAIREMKKFRDEGLIRFIGLRGPHRFASSRRDDPSATDEYARFMKLEKLIDPDVISVRYNMITPTYDRSPETDIFAWAEHTGRGLLTYKTLGQGLLLRKYDPSSPPVFSDGDHRARKIWYKSAGLVELNDRLERLSAEFGCKSVGDYVRLAVSYSLGRSAHHCALVGFKNEEQLKDTIGEDVVPMSPDEMQIVREVFSGVKSKIGRFIDFEAGS